ncbi:MAG: cation-translocating P-type ATPase [Bacteroidia bacterium]|nr:cation-translocating P-type ATPase [Bacteroidia bacterium]
MTAAEPRHIELQVKGMTCTNCALGIETYLRREGLDGVSVNFTTEEVSFDLGRPERLGALIQGIERLGYQVVKEDAPERGPSKVERLFLASIVFTLPLLAHMVLPMHWLHDPWVQCALATPVFAIGLYHFGRSALSSLRSGVPNMDVLIIIGAISAYGYSLYGALMQLGPDFLFFETAASIISLVLLGNVIEHRAVRRTTSAIRELSGLQPQEARRIISDGGSEQLELVPIRQVRPGERLQVHSGERIPADGEVESGEGELDESMLTGESLPQLRGPGAPVIGGTVLVSGVLRMRASATGKATLLSQIIELVKKAQADKPAIQQLADRISAVFVPAVLAVSLAAFLLSWGLLGTGIEQALIRSVAVLVVACPCAMGLATPTAVVVGIGRASRAGILVKGGRTLELFAGIRRVVFDKTGTLTTGQFALKRLHAAPEDLPAVRQAMAGLARHSSHPVSRSLAAALSGEAAQEWASVQEIQGLGMRGVDTEGTEYQLGSQRLVQGLEAVPGHSVYLLRNGRVWASAELEDEIRPGAQEAVAYLKAQGIVPVLLSGDRRAICERVAAELGISEVYAEQLPQDKLRIIGQFAAESPTAMVGDGVNDAPALARATVGISLSQATEVAMQAAQVVLLNGRLGLLPELHRISRLTVRTIRENLFWAFFYNVLTIPLAAAGFLRPVFASLSMAFSDVMVVGNSLRLRKRVGSSR